MMLSYLGRSEVKGGPYRSIIQLAPNLSREQVGFDGELADPVRFREVISALHDVVVGDLRFKKRDRTAYFAWKAQQKQEETRLRAEITKQAREAGLDQPVQPTQPPPKDLNKRFRAMHKRYWTARRKYARDLSRDDPELFRHLVPCDPVVTVAPDAILFEGFSKDESSYGCVVIDRGAIGGSQEAELGTTNVDYSLALYDHFQTLRTYRPTRLHVDPAGFEVHVEGNSDYREEKIDLPPSWLRGFGQISAATALPTRKIELPVEVVYSILAFLKRHREREGPRSIKVVLTPGRTPELTLEPWGVPIINQGPIYRGDRSEVIKVWGRRRLFVLARLLPLVERFEVHLLGSGLPSLWVAYMGELRFVLGLSGWTTNDWASGANLELLADAWQPDELTIERVTELLRLERRATFDELFRRINAPRQALQSALFRMAQRGQCIFDFSAGAYRYRQILPAPLGEDQLGPEPVELTEGRKLFVAKAVTITAEEALPGGRRLLQASVQATECESIIDADGVMTKARCPCVHHKRFGIRKGPCRHLLALRLQSQGVDFTLPATAGVDSGGS